MKKHTPQFAQPQLPFDAIEPGYCHCGCGQKTTLARKTATRDGITKGQPFRYLRGHHLLKRQIPDSPNPSGLCMCGCGQPAPIARQTDTKRGEVKGQPLRYLHHHKGLETAPKEAPNPSGFCMCGCGELAPIASENNAKLGHMKGYPVRFIVGHHNRLKPSRPVEDRFWEKVDRRGLDDCWLWQGKLNPHGYGQFHYKGKCWAASRFAYFLANGSIPDGMDVLHNCPGGDQPACCNPAHLWEGTQADNSLDMWAKGRGSKPPRTDHRGEKAPNALFTNAQVREFRRQHEKLGITPAELARAQNVDWDTMAQILKYKCYQDA